MGFIIGGFIISFFAIVLLIIGVALAKEGNSFEQLKRRGKAEIVGYDGAEQSSWYTLLVKIPELNDGKLYSCDSGEINLADYPKGTIIDVLYAQKKVLGMKVVEVHLLNKPPMNSSKFGNGIKCFSFILLVVAFVLVMVGLVYIL